MLAVVESQALTAAFRPDRNLFCCNCAWNSYAGVMHCRDAHERFMTCWTVAGLINCTVQFFIATGTRDAGVRGVIGITGLVYDEQRMG